MGSLRIELDLQHVVNDLLMALFFYVVALEVKRELVHGDLRDRRAAAVPAAAALGTMIGAAAAYLAINVSPLARMEERLHPWSAYLVLPVFALANAGVEVSAAELGDALTSRVGLGILIGLVIGAPLGGILLATAAVRATPARLPPGLDWSRIAAVAPLKGIGFTVAIFIASLAFTDSASLDQAKLAILMGSAIAAALGIGALWLRHRLAR